MIGIELSKILSEIESTLWEFESNNNLRPQYTDEGFRAALKIFTSAVMDRLWVLQSKEDIDIQTRCDMATKCGEEIRKIVKVYTDIDTFDLYK